MVRTSVARELLSPAGMSGELSRCKKMSKERVRESEKEEEDKEDKGRGF